MNIDQNLYSLLNQSKQLEKFILINSNKPLNQFKFKLADLESELKVFC